MINTLSAILSEAMQDDSTFVRAEACYRATFRSEPFLLGSVSGEEKEFYIEVLNNEVAKLILSRSGIFEPLPIFDDCHEITNFWELENYLEKLENVFVPELPDTMQICELCNYKGEGEGFSLYLHVKHLPVFKNKSASYSHFGC